MKNKRILRLNSLLREVISEVIHENVKNPNIAPQFISVVSVDITKDLKNAKVLISVIGSQKEKTNTIEALNQAAKFISIQSAKKVVIKNFPSLKFELDTSLENLMKLEKILSEINEEKEKRLNSKDE